MRSYVCFLWRTGFREYLPEHVNALAHAVQHFDPDPHRFICITDDKGEFSPAVEIFAMPPAAKALGKLQAPQGKGFPASYRRLWCFSPEAKVLGDRIMLLDIDAMVLSDLRPLWETEGDFVGWRPQSIWGKEDRIGGGTWLHTPGTITKLWDDFIANPQKMIDDTRAIGWNGSDQAIMSRFLVPKYPVWPRKSGIYSHQDGVMKWDLPPKASRIVHWNGSEKYWAVNKLYAKAYFDHFKQLP